MKTIYSVSADSAQKLDRDHHKLAYQIRQLQHSVARIRKGLAYGGSEAAEPEPQLFFGYVDSAAHIPEATDVSTGSGLVQRWEIDSGGGLAVTDPLKTDTVHHFQKTNIPKGSLITYQKEQSSDKYVTTDTFFERRGKIDALAGIASGNVGDVKTYEDGAILSDYIVSARNQWSQFIPYDTEVWIRYFPFDDEWRIGAANVAMFVP